MIIEGESGANDPVGIALLLSLLAVGENLDAGAAWSVALTFAEQMAVGLIVGIGGGWLLVTAMMRMLLPSEGLYTLRPVASAIAIYGVATIAHARGSSRSSSLVSSSETAQRRSSVRSKASTPHWPRSPKSSHSSCLD